MNILKITGLALGLAACSTPQAPDTCPDELSRALGEARDHEQIFEDAHAFNKVRPGDCKELLEGFSKKYNAIFQACEAVIERAKEKEAAEAKLKRERERAAWCKGEDIPQPK